MVEIKINGQTIEMKDSNLKYVKQVNDLADVTTVNSSYGYASDAPKTFKNTKTFEGLGLVGDTSKIPYSKNKTQVISNGAMIVHNGNSYVKETSKDYKLVIQDGIIDFFRAIENKTLGDELDLSELSHTKTDVNIIASFTNPNYRYLISEYNGFTVKDNKINPDYQIPSINNKYLFDKIMDFAGYTYEGLPSISDEWITYPSPPAIPTDEDVLMFTGTKYDVQNFDLANWKNNYNPKWSSVSFIDTNVVTLENNWKLKLKNTGNYKVEYSVTGTMLYGVLEGQTLYTLRLPLKVSFYKIKEKLISVKAIQGNVIKLFSASASQTVHFFPETLTTQEAQDFGVTDQRFLDAFTNGDFYVLQVNGGWNAELNSQGFEVFDFGEALKDYSMTDFIKEVMFRKSLTPFPDVDGKHIKFQTLKQRLDISKAVDWSNKYGGRVNEFYEFGSYAISNSLLMRHDNDQDTFGNGNLIVPNENIKDSQALFQSKYFAPSGDLLTIRTLTGFFYLIKFWDREVKDEEGVQSIEYKPLKNRFFLLKEQTVNDTIKIGDLTNPSYPKAIVTGTMMEDVVAEYYDDWGRIFNDLRIHNIELMINEYDVSTLEMDRPYYFKQEASYYLLNRLIYESGKPAMGEFLKIK